MNSRMCQRAWRVVLATLQRPARRGHAARPWSSGWSASNGKLAPPLSDGRLPGCPARLLDGVPPAPSHRARAQAGSPALHLPAYDAWDGLAMEYAAAWPLPLLLTPAALAAYGGLSRFLLRLARAAAELDAAWAALRGGGRGRCGAGRPAGAGAGLPRALWHLRHRVAHLIGNLLVYVQARARGAPGAGGRPRAQRRCAGSAARNARAAAVPPLPIQAWWLRSACQALHVHIRRAAKSCASVSHRMHALGVACAACPACQLYPLSTYP